MFKELFTESKINEVHIDGKKTMKDLQGTDDGLYALSPAMEKIFGKSKVNHHWRLEFPSVEGKTPNSKFVFGISLDLDNWKALSFMVVLDNTQMLVKDVAKIKDTDTVDIINKRAIGLKRELLQEFKDIQTIPGTAEEVQAALVEDGYTEIG